MYENRNNIYLYCSYTNEQYPVYAYYVRTLASHEQARLSYTTGVLLQRLALYRRRRSLHDRRRHHCVYIWPSPAASPPAASGLFVSYRYVFVCINSNTRKVVDFVTRCICLGPRLRVDVGFVSLFPCLLPAYLWTPCASS